MDSQFNSPAMSPTTVGSLTPTAASTPSSDSQALGADFNNTSSPRPGGAGIALGQPLLHEEMRPVINRYCENVLAYANISLKRSEIVYFACEHRLCCPMIHILAADYHVCQAGFFDANARASLERASEALNRTRLDLHETGAKITTFYLRAFNAWQEGLLKETYELFKAILTLDPTDLFALKRAQLVAFLRGDTDGLIKVVKAVEPYCSGLPFYHGMLGFSLEQSGDLEAALAHGRRGVRIHPNDAWSQHAVAHCLYFKGDLEGVIEWLDQFKHHWEDLMPFMRTHCHWHVALCLLDLCKFERLQDIFWQELWRPEDRLSLEVQLGASSLLWRMELHAVMFQTAPEVSCLFEQESTMGYKQVCRDAQESGEWAVRTMQDMEEISVNAGNPKLVEYPLYQLFALRVICSQMQREDVARSCFKAIELSCEKDPQSERSQVYWPLAKAIWHVYGPKAAGQDPGPDWGAAAVALQNLTLKLVRFMDTVNSSRMLLTSGKAAEQSASQSSPEERSASVAASHSMPSAGLAPIGGSGEQREAFLEFIWVVNVRAGLISSVEVDDLSQQLASATTSDHPADPAEESKRSENIAGTRRAALEGRLERLSQQHQQQLVCFGMLHDCIAHSHYRRCPAAMHLFATGLAELSVEHHRQAVRLCRASFGKEV